MKAQGRTATRLASVSSGTSVSCGLGLGECPRRELPSVSVMHVLFSAPWRAMGGGGGRSAAGEADETLTTTPTV